MLDLYAGTGSIGIEALSRGASHVTFVETDRERCASSVPISSNAEWKPLPIFAPVRSLSFSPRHPMGGPTTLSSATRLIDSPEVLSLAGNWQTGWLADDAIVIIEHSNKADIPAMLGPLAPK